MSADWSLRCLGDVCRVVGGGTPSKANHGFYAGSIPWATVRDMRQDVIHDTEFRITREAVEGSATSIVPAGNVVIATRVGLGKVCLLGQDTAINQDLRGIIPKDNNVLLARFLFWWLKSVAHLLVAEGAGATVQGIRLPFVKSLKVPVPSLLEQERIVGVLDDVFEELAVAKGNVEKNLQNVQELFVSCLRGSGAECALLGDLVNIATGKLDANAAVEGGAYPFFTCSRQVYAIDRFAFDCEAILLAGNNAVGDFSVKHFSGKFNAYQRTYVMTVKDGSRALCRFLYFQVMRGLKKFKAQSVGTGTKFLKMGMISGLEVFLPSLEEQARLVLVIDSVQQETQRLAAIYKQKLTALDELKKSLLHQAFTGNL